MTLASWAKKELGRLGIQKPKKRLLLPGTSSDYAKCSTMSSVQEVVLAADLKCDRCQKRVAGLIAKIDDFESMVVHVLEKKVTIVAKS